MSEVDRLSVLVQRLADADLLDAAQAGELIAEAQAAGRFWREGDGDSAKCHVELIAQFTRALVKTDALTIAEGRAVIQLADGILGRDE
jgi:hypothetical protein